MDGFELERRLTAEYHHSYQSYLFPRATNLRYAMRQRMREPPLFLGKPFDENVLLDADYSALR